MRKLPILFSAPMVRAVLDGRKTVTRRVVKPLRGRHIVNLAVSGGDVDSRDYSGLDNDPSSWGYLLADDGVDIALADWSNVLAPYQVGDRLWVRETWKTHSTFDHLAPRDVPQSNVFYAAGPQAYSPSGSRWRSSIHMPRWASRITLEVTAVRAERLQDISEAQARAEGLLHVSHGWRGAPDLPWFASPVAAFRSLWESINGAGSWDDNPWVWCIEFRRVEVPHAG